MTSAEPHSATKGDAVTTSELVFDPFSQEFFDDPQPIYRRMRDEAPVYYNPEYDFYALTRHADVAAAFKDFETYTSTRGVDLQAVKSGEPPPMSIIMMDPPEHRRMRSLVNKVFTPRAMSHQQEMVTEQIDRFLGAVKTDVFDVVQDFAALFPIEFIAQMLGVPAEQRQQIRHWVDITLEREIGSMEVPESSMNAAIETGMFYYNLIQERRAELQDDMLSDLIRAKVERDAGGETQLDDIEITGFATLLGGAGAETVTKLVGSAIVTFADHPDQWQKLLDDRSKIPAAVEELLRYIGPVQYNVRCSLREVHLHGVTIPAGKPVFLIGASANRDSEAFTDADVFDIDRDRAEAQNLGLGYGVHSCLGAALARMETRIALERLLDFMPRYELQRDGLKRVVMINVSGWSHVPVRVLR
jgi:cytochrome P450